MHQPKHLLLNISNWIVKHHHSFYYNFEVIYATVKKGLVGASWFSPHEYLAFNTTLQTPKVSLVHLSSPPFNYQQQLTDTETFLVVMKN
jgi:hypothetical protein